MTKKAAHPLTMVSPLLVQAEFWPNRSGSQEVVGRLNRLIACRAYKMVPWLRTIEKSFIMNIPFSFVKGGYHAVGTVKERNN